MLEAIERFGLDLLLLGACGVDAEAGITAHSLDDAVSSGGGRARRPGRGRRRPGKLGTAAPFAVMDLAAFDVLLIEAATPPDIRARSPPAARLIDVETE